MINPNNTSVALKDSKPQQLTLLRFKGINQQYSISRLPKEYAYQATNLMLVGDGWQTRWGSKQYAGVSWTATPDGFTEYTKSNGDRELIVVGDGKVWKVDPTTSTKTEITGATYTVGKKVYFLQIGFDLYIGNGYDSLARYNGSTLSTYSGLTTPSGTSATRGAGLTSGSYTLYYRVSAVNSVGETVASAEFTTTVNKRRDTWVLASNEYVDVAWSAVAGALKYVVYFDTVTGYGQKLAEVNGTTYRDDSSGVPNPYIAPPISDTTTGPKLGPMCLSNNRIWGIEGNSGGSNQYTVYFSGSGQYLGNFSPAFGGGWVRLEYGSKAKLEQIVDFQGKPRVLASTPDGRGNVWEVDITTQQIEDQSFAVPIPTKIITAVGTDSPRSLSFVENDVAFWNKSRVSILGNEPGVLNVLRVNEISTNIRDTVSQVPDAGRPAICSHYFDRKIFFSIPSSDASAPDQIWVLDREKVEWYGPWTFGVTQFGEYTDDAGVTHLLGISGTMLIEISEGILGDMGQAFSQQFSTGRIPIDASFTQFAKVKKNWIRFKSPRGTINWQVYGTGKRKGIKSILSRTIEATQSLSGIGNDLIGNFSVGETNGVPVVFADESLIKEGKINELVRDIQLNISSDKIDDQWTLTGWVGELLAVKTGSPSEWRR